MRYSIGNRTKVSIALIGIAFFFGLVNQVSGYGLSQGTAEPISNGITNDTWLVGENEGYYTIGCTAGDTLNVTYTIVTQDNMILRIYDPDGVEVGSHSLPAAWTAFVSVDCLVTGDYDIYIFRTSSTGTNSITMTITGATTPGSNIPGYPAVMILFIALGMTSLLIKKFFKRKVKVEK